jgi:hypothetical protein
MSRTVRPDPAPDDSDLGWRTAGVPPASASEESGRDARAPRRLFQPSAASLNWVIAVGFIAIGYAIYLRYLVIEQTQIGLACDAGLRTWQCLSRTVVSALFENEVFGWISLGAAVLTLIRPVLPLFTICLAASAFGIVLHNAGLSGLAAALLIMSFARPVVDES